MKYFPARSKRSSNITWPFRQIYALIAISNGFIPSLFKPEITYVETSGAEPGKKAFASMLQALLPDTPPIDEIIPARLIEGGSI